MQQYELVLFAQRGQPRESVTIFGNGPDVVFGWAQRHAHGRPFEIFGDGASLGIVSLAPDGEFWMLSAPTQAETVKVSAGQTIRPIAR